MNDCKAELRTIGADDLARLAFGKRYTKFSKKTICTAIRKGEILARKVGREYRILEHVGLEWLQHRYRS